MFITLDQNLKNAPTVTGSPSQRLAREAYQKSQALKTSEYIGTPRSDMMFPTSKNNLQQQQTQSQQGFQQQNQMTMQQQYPNSDSQLGYNNINNNNQQQHQNQYPRIRKQAIIKLVEIDSPLKISDVVQAASESQVILKEEGPNQTTLEYSSLSDGNGGGNGGSGSKLRAMHGIDSNSSIIDGIELGKENMLFLKGSQTSRWLALSFDKRLEALEWIEMLRTCKKRRQEYDRQRAVEIAGQQASLGPRVDRVQTEWVTQGQENLNQQNVITTALSQGPNGTSSLNVQMSNQNLINNPPSFGLPLQSPGAFSFNGNNVSPQQQVVQQTTNGTNVPPLNLMNIAQQPSTQPQQLSQPTAYQTVSASSATSMTSLASNANGNNANGMSQTQSLLRTPRGQPEQSQTPPSSAKRLYNSIDQAAFAAQDLHREIANKIMLTSRDEGYGGPGSRVVTGELSSNVMVTPRGAAAPGQTVTSESNITPVDHYTIQQQNINYQLNNNVGNNIIMEETTQIMQQTQGLGQPISNTIVELQNNQQNAVDTNDVNPILQLEPLDPSQIIAVQDDNIVVTVGPQNVNDIINQPQQVTVPQQQVQTQQPQQDIATVEIVQPKQGLTPSSLGVTPREQRWNQYQKQDALQPRELFSQQKYEVQQSQNMNMNMNQNQMQKQSQSQNQTQVTQVMPNSAPTVLQVQNTETKTITDTTNNNNDDESPLAKTGFKPNQTGFQYAHAQQIQSSTDVQNNYGHLNREDAIRLLHQREKECHRLSRIVDQSFEELSIHAALIKQLRQDAENANQRCQKETQQNQELMDKIRTLQDKNLDLEQRNVEYQKSIQEKDLEIRKLQNEALHYDAQSKMDVLASKLNHAMKESEELRERMKQKLRDEEELRRNSEQLQRNVEQFRRNEEQFQRNEEQLRRDQEQLRRQLQEKEMEKIRDSSQYDGINRENLQLIENLRSDSKLSKDQIHELNTIIGCLEQQLRTEKMDYKNQTDTIRREQERINSENEQLKENVVQMRMKLKEYENNVNSGAPRVGPMSPSAVTNASALIFRAQPDDTPDLINLKEQFIKLQNEYLRIVHDNSTLQSDLGKEQRQSDEYSKMLHQLNKDLESLDSTRKKLKEETKLLKAGLHQFANQKQAHLRIINQLVTMFVSTRWSEIPQYSQIKAEALHVAKQIGEMCKSSTGDGPMINGLGGLSLLDRSNQSGGSRGPSSPRILGSNSVSQTNYQSQQQQYQDPKPLDTQQTQFLEQSIMNIQSMNDYTSKQFQEHEIAMLKLQQHPVDNIIDNIKHLNIKQKEDMIEREKQQQIKQGNTNCNTNLNVTSQVRESSLGAMSSKSHGSHSVATVTTVQGHLNTNSNNFMMSRTPILGGRTVVQQNQPQLLNKTTTGARIGQINPNLPVLNQGLINNSSNNNYNNRTVNTVGIRQLSPPPSHPPLPPSNLNSIVTTQSQSQSKSTKLTILRSQVSPRSSTGIGGVTVAPGSGHNPNGVLPQYPMTNNVTVGNVGKVFRAQSPSAGIGNDNSNSNTGNGQALYYPEDHVQQQQSQNQQVGPPLSYETQSQNLHLQDTLSLKPPLSTLSQQSGRTSFLGSPVLTGPLIYQPGPGPVTVDGNTNLNDRIPPPHSLAVNQNHNINGGLYIHSSKHSVPEGSPVSQVNIQQTVQDQQQYPNVPENQYPSVPENNNSNSYQVPPNPGRNDISNTGGPQDDFNTQILMQRVTTNLQNVKESLENTFPGMQTSNFKQSEQLQNCQSQTQTQSNSSSLSILQERVQAAAAQANLNQQNFQQAMSIPPPHPRSPVINLNISNIVDPDHRNKQYPGINGIQNQSQIQSQSQSQISQSSPRSLMFQSPIRMMAKRRL